MSKKDVEEQFKRLKKSQNSISYPLVSVTSCYAFLDLVKDSAHPAYNIKPEPAYIEGNCMIGIVNTSMSVDNYGNLALYKDGHVMIDIPRRIRNPGHAEKLIEELEICNCDGVWVHPHIWSPEIKKLGESANPDLTIIAQKANRSLDNFHYHARIPPTARRCAIRKILEES